MSVLFFSALAVGFSGAMMPGSLLTYTIDQSMRSGVRAGLFISAGHAALELVLIILIFLGFGTVLQSGTAQIIISLVGGALLLLMGVQMLMQSIKNKLQIKTEAPGSKAKTFRLFLSGAVISATNPYFLLWWAVVGLGFIMQSYNTLGAAGVCVYYLGHISADFIWYVFISAVTARTRRFIKNTPYRIILAGLGGLLLFFGTKFILGISAYL